MAKYRVNKDIGVMFGGQHFGPGKTLDTEKWELTEKDAAQIEEWAEKGYIQTESQVEEAREGEKAAREHARQKAEPEEEVAEDADEDEDKPAKRGGRGRK